MYYYWLYLQHWLRRQWDSQVSACLIGEAVQKAVIRGLPNEALLTELHFS